MRKCFFLILPFISSVSYCQISKIDVGLGVSYSPEQETRDFEVDTFLIDFQHDGQINEQLFVRVIQTIKQFELLHTASIHSERFRYAIRDADLTPAYSRSVTYRNLAYDFQVKLLAIKKIKFVAGIQGNFYFVKNARSNYDDPDRYPVDLTSYAVKSLQPTFGFSLGVQANITKRLVLNYAFQQQLTSYLGSFEYAGKTYTPPKRRMEFHTLFLTYTVFKPKAEKA